jgi:hypothetical protein
MALQYMLNRIGKSKTEIPDKEATVIHPRRIVSTPVYVALVAALCAGIRGAPQAAPTDPAGKHERAGRDYVEMLAKVKQGDLTVDFNAFRAAASAKDDPHQSNVRETMELVAFRNLAASGDWAGALAAAEKALERNYASSIAHSNALIACKALHKEDDAAVHQKILQALLESIRKSGDGKSPETAFLVYTTQEDYVFLRMALHLVPKSQASAFRGGHAYDAITVIDPETNQTQNLWFSADYDNPLLH